MASKETRRTEIMEAAIELFARQGFHAATIGDIASAAAIGKGTVYEYFPSKQRLFHDSIEYLFVLYNERLHEILVSAPDLSTGLRGFVKYQMSAYDRSVCLIQSLNSIPVSLTEELKLLWQRQQSETLLCLQDFIARVTPSDTRQCGDRLSMAAMLVYGAVNQYCLQRMLSDSLGEEDQVAVCALVSTIEFGVRGRGISE